MTSISLTVPLPPKYRATPRNGKPGRWVCPLSPNARCHWRVVSKAKKAYRDSVTARILLALGEGRMKRYGWTHVTVKYDWHHETASLMDPDNIPATMKYALDCFVKAGILTDDDHATPLPPGRFVDPDGEGFVVITITPTGADHE